MFDVVADLTSTKPAAPPLPPPLPTATESFAQKTGRRLTIQIPSSPVTESQFKLPAALPVAYDGSNQRHQSLQFTPTSPVFSFHRQQESTSDDEDEDGCPINIETPSPEATDDNEPTPPSFWSLMCSTYTTVPNKPILFLSFTS
jgi:hypothetical protein